MMTSVAGGYPSPSPSPTPTSAEVDTDVDVATLRLKRPPPLTNDTCKKRRKQSTPIRISNTDIGDLPLGLGLGLCYEGKMSSPLQSPGPEELDAVVTHATAASNIVKVEQSSSPAESSSPSLPVNLSGGQNFPPWLSDMQPKSNDWLNANASSNFYVPVPVSRAPSASLSQSQSQPPIRIFNPEAYCELCNKEFCNKYFLKTHKANKHRIYTDPPISDAMSVSLPPVNVPNFTAMKKAIPIPVPVPVAVPVPIPTVPTNAEIPNPIPKNSAQTHVDFANIFCDLCGKGFSNSIMLKTHRVTIHGTADSELTAELGITLPLESPLKEEHERDCDNGETADKENMIYKSENFKEDQITNHLLTLDQDENTENQQQNRDRENLDFSINRPRRLGIMNPEAFCEICCKEYCNKYFLRTHKMKRHGIIIPDENSKDNQKDFKLELSISNNWYQIQTSPLNLIMGEQNTNSSGSCERKSSPANENECEICGMRFQTLYLAQLHFATAHSQCRPTNSDEFSATLSVNNNDKQAPDSISEDLQKLQTMILQLNELDVSKVGVTNAGSILCSCSMCGKEFENRYYLHAHLMTEHGVLLENNSSNITEIDNGGEMTSEVNLDNQLQHKITNNSTTISTATSLCATSSSLMDKKDDSNGFIGPEKMRTISNGNVVSERRSSLTMTPANSYCEICNKELCNKYFMKTHMQRMHGIEIENGAQIGGVVCNICNKELCSKYFLRVHKHNTHGIVQDNIGGTSNQTQSRPHNLDLELPISGSATTPAPSSTDVGSGSDCTLKLSDLSDLSNRYFTHFTEVCTICSRRFRSTKWLKAHLLGDHGKAGTDKWNELEIQLQSFGQQHQTQQRKSNADRSSPTLRIPNGGQDITTKPETGGMQNVLSSIFGSDEANVKQYHCSFCSFSTPVLAFLFVHERSHSHIMNTSEISNSTSNNGTNTTATPSAVSPLYCAVCNQSFRQPEQLHHHIVQQHTFLSFFGNVRQRAPLEEPKQEEETPKTTEADHKCNACGSGRSKEFKELDVLKNFSKQRQLPATYALPQPQLKAKYTMQAFLMDEPPLDVLTTKAVTVPSTEKNKQINGDEEQLESGSTTLSSDRRFVPSIVFLPVLEKQTAPLTVSFTLTPA